MSRTATGHGHPRFTIRESNGAYVTEYDLDLTNEGGLVETYQDHSVINDMGDGAVRGIYKKDRIIFTLYYDRWLLLPNALKLQEIRRHEKGGRRLFLTPRVDRLGRYFEVMTTGAGFDMAVLKNAEKAKGNKQLVISWQTKFLVDPNWSDPDDIYVPIDNFITLD